MSRLSASICAPSYGGDDESLHESEALALWAGVDAIRLIDRLGPAVLLERADPGTDLAVLAESEAVAVAVDLALRLWRPAQEPFRPVRPAVRGWLERAGRSGNPLVPRAYELLNKVEPSADWVVHGDFHHHNILRDGDRFLVIDPKPYLADREYDVPAFLWNPLGNQLDDRELLESRIRAFVAAGLDEFRIRAWTIIRGAYLRPEHANNQGATGLTPATRNRQTAREDEPCRVAEAIVRCGVRALAQSQRAP